MRLSKYIEISNKNDDIVKFRIMKIGLLKENSQDISFVKRVCEEYEINEINEIIKDLNKELKKHYNGSYFYNLTLDEESNNIKIEDICKKSKKCSNLIVKFFEANDRLSKVKSMLEEKLKK